MTAQVQTLRNSFPQRIIQIDGIVEMVLGAGMLLDSTMIAGWLGLRNGTSIAVSGIGVMLFGALLLYIAQRHTSRRTLMILGIANIAFALVCGILLALDWNVFATEGRWLAAIVVDVFVGLGVAELFARRFTA